VQAQLLNEVTLLLERWGGGDSAALSQATELLYPELHRIAHSYFSRERFDHTLQPTALIHEAYVRLLRIDHLSFENRRQFLGLVARLMRQVLVDHARQVQAQRRGGDAIHISTEEAAPAGVPDHASRFLELNDVLDQLGRINERRAKILELRYFGGFGVEETGELLGVSAATVSREQRMAEAWLHEAMHGGLQT